MPDHAVLPSHCWVCARYAQCSCEACQALVTSLREAQAEADRGETLDLGSFARYADEVPVSFVQVVGGGFVKAAAKEA